MKKLIYAAALTLLLTSTIPAAQATGVPGDVKASHIVHTGAHPFNARSPNATHHFELHVEGPSLSQLSIDVPEGIRIGREIEITDRAQKKVEATVSIQDRKAKITFAKPVPSGTTLSISMKGIRTSSYLGRTWLYRVSSQMVGLIGDIPLGTAQIRTYD